MVVVKKNSLSLIFIIGSSLFFNFFYLYKEARTDFIKYITNASGMAWIGPAYAFYKHKISNKPLCVGVKRREYLIVPYNNEDQPEKISFPMVETVGYPFLASLVWKISGSSSLWYLKILNILLFVLTLFFLRRVLKYLFLNDQFALLATF